MGDSDTWAASEAELLDIARDEGIDDPGNDPHMLPEKDCQVRISSLYVFLVTCVSHSESWNPFKENIILRTFCRPGVARPCHRFCNQLEMQAAAEQEINHNLRTFTSPVMRVILAPS